MGGEQISASLIVTTYEWPEALRLTLQSVVRQSKRPGQVIVADDGSGYETRRVVEEVLGPSDIIWAHVWQEDRGVRQSRIKNLAVKYSDQPYLIFIDHDTVIHSDFVSDHLQMTERRFFLQGKRSLLPKPHTERMLSAGFFKPPKPWLKGLGNRKNTVRSTILGRVFLRSKNYETALRGCNLSMYKSDFLKVDGFDETFDGSWGREDSDFCYRLFHAGIKIKTLWFTALQYHLHHGLVEKWDKKRLDNELQKNVHEKRIRALKGFSRLSSEGKIIASSKEVY